MAKISKAQDTANYRKGKELQVGDLVAIRWEGPKPVEFSAIESIEMVSAESAGQRGGRQYRANLENGTFRVATGGEFVEGKY